MDYAVHGYALHVGREYSVIISSIFLFRLLLDLVESGYQQTFDNKAKMPVELSDIMISKNIVPRKMLFLNRITII